MKLRRLLRSENQEHLTKNDPPCFLVVDKPDPGSIPARKLVIETAQLNVLTACSGEEALATLVRFPAMVWCWTRRSAG